MAAHERSNGLLSSASYLIALQAGSRLVTFGLNQALLRLATPQAFGTVAIQLELLLNTILFFSRESFRNAALRIDRGSLEDEKTRSQLIRTTTLPVLIGLPVSITLSSIYVHFAAAEVVRQDAFRAVVATYAVSALVELAAEPMFVLSQLEMDQRLRVRAEGAAVIVRAVVTVGSLATLGDKQALAAFAAGQLAFAVVLLVVLSHAYGHRVFSRLQRSASCHQPTLILVWALIKQSIVKQCLQEGDKLAVSRLSPIVDQGAYAVALNYGSLVVRIIFQPLEETARLYFSRSAPSTKRPTVILSLFIYLHLTLALLALTFAPPYIPFLSHLLLGRRWHYSSASTLLRIYVHLLPLLGLNGILEAYVHSTATPSELSNNSRMLLVASLVFAGNCYIVRDGATAALAGTAASMAMRIAWSLRFVRTKWSNERWWKSPRWPVLVAYSLSAIVIRVYEPMTRCDDWREHGRHFGVGVGCLLFCVAISAWSELPTWRYFRAQLRQGEEVGGKKAD